MNRITAVRGGLHSIWSTVAISVPSAQVRGVRQVLVQCIDTIQVWKLHSKTICAEMRTSRHPTFKRAAILTETPSLSR